MLEREAARMQERRAELQDARAEMLALSAEEAYDELSGIQGADVARWNWGDLHALTTDHAEETT